ncbi:Separin [Bienertia sinuspersici]
MSGVRAIDQIYYSKPGADTLESGLTRVYSDDEIRIMAELGLKVRCLDCYVVEDNKVGPKLGDGMGCQSKRRKKLSLRRKATNTQKQTDPQSIGPSKADSQNQILTKPSKPNLDTQPSVLTANAPLDTQPLFQTKTEFQSSSNPIFSRIDIVSLFNPTDFKEWLGSFETYVDIAADRAEDGDGCDDGDGGGSEDKEDLVAFENDTDDDEFKQLRDNIEAWNAKALSVARELPKKIWQRALRRKEDLLVNMKRVEMSCTQLEKVMMMKEFKECVVRYVVAQGKNVTWVVSDKNRNQRLGVKCNPGCPFRLYCSWDKRRGTLVVKSVEDQHTCYRNMEANRQLNSTWIASQLLELFKVKPHWPAKDIFETIRIAYKVLVNKPFAYKVKYYAHTLLHGSMKQHYNSLGSYLEALKIVSPSSYFRLEVDPETNPPTFTSVFFYFDGVKQGWTFLGGMLLSVVGRDGNEQMFPLTWAVCEGETKATWIGF